MTRHSIGVDVGGTFTDLVAVSDEGTIAARKVLSTPADQAEGVLAALAALAVAGKNVSRFIHGTTVATNTLLERTGARVVLCATDGASDLLELRRQARAALYDLTRHHPAPLVPPELTASVRERIGPDHVERGLDQAGIDAVVERVRALAPEVVAISLLHSYRDASHERALAEALERQGGGAPIVCSYDVLPEIREYERTATTVAEAYLRPRVDAYLRRLDASLRARGHPALGVMTSSGGVVDATVASRSAASLALSGPAGGVVAAAIVARAAGFANALTVDIGGTSADAGLVLDNEPLVEPGDEIAGVPIALPRVLVDTVSAGGGSIAWIDDGGALRVGPRSAGALPGPAAFGRGGTEPTVTDAHLVLGNIVHPRMSGDVSLDRSAAERTVGALAGALGVEPRRAAAAIVASADAAVARALRRVSVERGVDPRRLVLVAFGGGGPLHACGLADHLGMRAVLIPPQAGVLSALGLAVAAERRESLASVTRLTSELDDDALRRLREDLSQRAGSPAGTIEHRSWLRARYAGQGHELDVPLMPGDGGASLAERFAVAHERRYGFTLERPVEIVSARHAVIAASHPLQLARRGAGTWDQRYEDAGGALDVTVRGRAVITLPDAALLVAEGWCARSLPIGGWLLERST